MVSFNINIIHHFNPGSTLILWLTQSTQRGSTLILWLTQSTTREYTNSVVDTIQATQQ